MFYLATTPWWLRIFFPRGMTWRLPDQEKVLYLTFDDGPHPTITPFVLDQLKRYGAAATFFCIGKNVVDYPEIYQRILSEGHRTGNHTHRHLNAKHTPEKQWLEDVRVASKCIDSDLFRPPYGRIRSFEAKTLREASPPYRIILWDVLSGDFDEKTNAQACTQNVIRNARPGSIVVFHDSQKAWKRLENCLPAVLKHFSEEGYSFRAIL
jgi:peptidoglycan/xylan/chitin deacetylase (PgdA/CDA1 family)